MFHTKEDEKRLFEDIEENARRGRRDQKRIDDEEFNRLIKKVDQKS